MHISQSLLTQNAKGWKAKSALIPIFIQINYTFIFFQSLSTGEEIHSRAINYSNGHELGSLEHQDIQRFQAKIDEAAFGMREKTAEVRPHNALPSSSIETVEFLLNMTSDICAVRDIIQV